MIRCLEQVNARSYLYLGAVIFCASAALVAASELKSEVILPAGQLTIHVSKDHALKILNFTQESGTTRGAVAVTTDAGTANVLTAAIIQPSPAPSPAPEVINTVVVAGPAMISLSCPSDATGCFLSYRKFDR